MSVMMLYEVLIVLFSSISSPPKKSLGKPALSKVPILETVNGDSDYTGAGTPQRTIEHVKKSEVAACTFLQYRFIFVTLKNTSYI